MAPIPNTAPALVDRALLQARRRRASKQGEATFLLDRVAEDMVDRLAAVKREFASAADIWTPGEGLASYPRFESFIHVAAQDSPQDILPLAPQSPDLAGSALAFHVVHDPPAG